MNPPRRVQRYSDAELAPVAALAEGLAITPEAGELLELIELCRRSLRVRAWLFGRFSLNRDLQAAFRQFLDDPTDLSAIAQLWPQEVVRVLQGSRNGQPVEAGPFGGLTETQVLALIRAYQAGFLDVQAFALVRSWHRFLTSGAHEPPWGVRQATQDYWRALIADTTTRRVRQLGAVLRFFQERMGRSVGAADFGHAGTWRLHLLVHILDHPKPRYSAAELHSSLPAECRHVDRREIRQFCQRHGIRRDSRPGRPRDGGTQR